MQVITIKEIDLSNCSVEDLELYYPRGSKLYIELESVDLISIYGHNMMSNIYYKLPIVERHTYDVFTDIHGDGAFDIDISAVDKIKIKTSGEIGKIFIKIIA